MSMPWTVIYMASLAPDGDPCVAVGEISSSPDIKIARVDAEQRFGTSIMAMIPGFHMEKTYIFDKWFADGREPLTMYNPRNKKWSANK
tara:strand:- start:585 stop:848 length:264 start_codon:yes stop_codon:yes gene_type:complete